MVLTCSGHVSGREAVVGYWRLCSWLEGRGSERQRQTGREDWNGKHLSGDGGCCDRCDSGQGRLCEKTSLLWTLTPDKVSLFCLALLTPNKVSLSCLSLFSLSLSLSLQSQGRRGLALLCMCTYIHAYVGISVCATVYEQDQHSFTHKSSQGSTFSFHS